jgi:hypothetical protein
MNGKSNRSLVMAISQSISIDNQIGSLDDVGDSMIAQAAQAGKGCAIVLLCYVAKECHFTNGEIRAITSVLVRRGIA